ncbi:MAG: hypothetical protein WKG32_07775 [Gemmatimonadaceae bacterium]
MRRHQWALLGLLAVLPVARMAAQRPVKTPQQEAYERKRADLAKEVDETQSRLSELRSQRVSLQARLEHAIAADMQQRAQQLLMSNEQNALQQLDSILVVAQDNLVSQRERFRDLGDAVRRRTGAVLVVVLRADSSGAQSLGATELQVDNGTAASRSYSAEANSALQLGAVDQLYRSEVLPTAHTVRIQVTVNGQPLTQSVDVSAQGETVTYIQFAVRNGQLVPTTWTSRGTTPF